MANQPNGGPAPTIFPYHTLRNLTSPEDFQKGGAPSLLWGRPRE